MQTEFVEIAALRPPEQNVRVHPEKQIVELARAVEKFGQTRPVIIDEDNVVLAGNGLVEACRRLDRSEVIVFRMTGLSTADKTKLMLSDNRIYSLGLDDHGAILDAIRGLKLDFDIPGFDAEILQNLTMDTSFVTELSLDNYGKLPAAAVSAARKRSIAQGSTAAPTPDPQTESDDSGETIACPHCGRRFTP
jgi:hypothetical protein